MKSQSTIIFQNQISQKMKNFENEYLCKPPSRYSDGSDEYYKKLMYCYHRISIGAYRTTKEKKDFSEKICEDWGILYSDLVLYGNERHERYRTI